MYVYVMCGSYYIDICLMLYTVHIQQSLSIYIHIYRSMHIYASISRYITYHTRTLALSLYLSLYICMYVYMYSLCYCPEKPLLTV